MKLNLSYLFDKKTYSVNLLDNRAHFQTYIKGALNETILNDGWKIAYSEDYDEALEQYIEPTQSIKDLKGVEVPLSLNLQGYGKTHYLNTGYDFDGRNPGKLGEKIEIPNPVGLYLKDLEIGKEELDFRQIIDFKGFETALYLYVNGEFVGYSENLYLDSFFDITPFIHEGKNRVAAFVFRYSTASWML
ncbi:MAG: hypothetical protein K6F32_07585, partial [Bacilli bacterium]|nr:hypothetical protein [Bacilli bacterium]